MYKWNLLADKALAVLDQLLPCLESQPLRAYAGLT